MSIRGIQKTRVTDPNLQRALDNIAEAIETLGGARNKTAESAVTYQDLIDNGFEVRLGIRRAGKEQDRGLQNTIKLPTTIGSCPAPATLAATADSTTHVVRLTWKHPDRNCQYVEIWRDPTGGNDRSADGIVITTAVAGYYEFCQSASDTTMHYWVRALGTDGRYTDFEPSSATAGIEADVT